MIKLPLTFRLISGSDPCILHQVISDQPERSFNHHLSVGRDPAVCDSELAEDWYRFNSPAGNLLPTECPGGNYCGTNIPVWMKGKGLATSIKIVRLWPLDLSFNLKNQFSDVNCKIC